MGLPGGSGGKDYASNAGDPGSIPGGSGSPWRREWLPTPVFLPGDGQKSNTTEQLINLKLYITKQQVLLGLYWAAQRVCSSFPKRWCEKPD